MAYSPVDKFLCVAKILTDARLQELVEENRKLKLALFWKTYDLRKLRDRIASAIQHRLNCKCKSCNFCGKSHEFNGEWECAVTRRFQDIAIEHGLSVAQESWDGPHKYYPIYDPELGNDEDDSDAQFFCDGDVHIVLPSSVTDWVVLGYGEKLNQAKSTEDPELIKLKKLFETLEA
jgi:hypothetical protein